MTELTKSITKHRIQDFKVILFTVVSVLHEEKNPPFKVCYEIYLNRSAYEIFLFIEHPKEVV